MTRTIEQLWNGTLEPIRHLGKNNSEIKHLEFLMQRDLEKLEENLNAELQEIFEKYSDCINEYILLISEQAFCDGFCLGTRITMESIFGAEQIL